MCKNCKEDVSKFENHKCYIQKVELKLSNDKIIISDFETYTNENNKQIVNKAISCYYQEETEEPENEHIKEEINFIRYNSIEEYCEWLLDKKHHGYTIIFHNGAGFDFHFIQEYMIKNNLKPDVIIV